MPLVLWDRCCVMGSGRSPAESAAMLKCVRAAVASDLRERNRTRLRDASALKRAGYL